METMEEQKTDELMETRDDRPQKQLFDPYLQRAEMPYTALHFPMGFPVQLSTNSLEVLAAAEESWGKFEQLFKMEPAQLQVGLREDGPTDCPGPLVPRAHGHLMMGVANAGNFFVADLLRNVCFAWISPGALVNRYYLRNDVLESAALSMIANRYCAPVHAACVALDGCGVLLCGDSGAGKSTLAFACAREGWTYVSDDASLLVHGRRDRQVLGNCHLIRLRAEAAELFPEARDRPLSQQRRGKPSIEIATCDLPIITAVESQVDYLIFLNRQSGMDQELRPYSKELARRYVQKHLNWSEQLRPEQIASTERILSADVFELCYQDLAWAIQRLDYVVRER